MVWCALTLDRMMDGDPLGERSMHDTQQKEKQKRRRRRRKSDHGPRRTILGVCRDCSLHQPTERVAFYRASLPRCSSVRRSA